MSTTEQDGVHPAEAEVRAVLAEYYRALQAAADAKGELRAKVHALSQIPSRATRVSVIRDLYWNHEVAGALDLTVGLLAQWDEEAGAPISAIDLGELAKRYAPRMREMCGPAGYEKCSFVDCSNMVPIASRAQRKLQNGHCGVAPCRSAHAFTTITEAERAERHQAEVLERERRVRRLRELEAASGLTADHLAELFSLMADRDHEARMTSMGRL